MAVAVGVALALLLPAQVPSAQCPVPLPAGVTKKITSRHSAVVTGFRLLSAEMAGALMICCAVLIFGLDYGTRICFLGEGHVGLGLLQVSCPRHGVGAAGT